MNVKMKMVQLNRDIKELTSALISQGIYADKPVTNLVYKAQMEQALVECNRDIEVASKALGISSATFRARMNNYG